MTPSTPDFTFLPICTEPITFAVRFQGTLNFTTRASGATAVEVAPTSQSAAWHCTGAGSTHSDACFAPATLTVNVASGVVSNPSGAVVPPTQ